MTLNKKKRIFYVIMGIIFVIMIILSIYTRKIKVLEHTKSLQEFYSTDVIGKVKSHSISGGYVYLKIHGYKNTDFQFLPIKSELNENTIFFHIIEKGDSIYKPKFSDTLELIKNGKKYKYTFENQPL